MQGNHGNLDQLVEGLDIYKDVDTTKLQKDFKAFKELRKKIRQFVDVDQDNLAQMLNVDVKNLKENQEKNKEAISKQIANQQKLKEQIESIVGLPDDAAASAINLCIKEISSKSVIDDRLKLDKQFLKLSDEQVKLLEDFKHKKIFLQGSLNQLDHTKLEGCLNTMGLDGLEPIPYHIPDDSINSAEFLKGVKYNLGYLEEAHVVRVSQEFANKTGVELYNPYVVNVGDVAKSVPNIKGQITSLISAMINVSRREPAQLFISNNSHWITCSILPTGEGRFVIVGMDSMSSCSNMKEIAGRLVTIGTRLGLDVIAPEGKQFYNLSVEGQQHGGCCGFAAACNGFSLQKTYKDLNKEDGSFDLDGFKSALLSNVVYRSEGGKAIFYGNKKIDIALEEFVRKAGGRMLQKISQPVQNQESGLDQVLPVSQQQGVVTNEPNPVGQEELLKQCGVTELPAGTTVLQQTRLPENLQNVLDNRKKKNLFIKVLHRIADRELFSDLESLNHLDGKLNQVIEAAFPKDGSEPKVDISMWQRIVLFLYSIPLIKNLIEFIDRFIVSVDVVDVTRTVNNLKKSCTKLQENNLYNSLIG